MEKYIWNSTLEAPFIASRQNPRVVSWGKLADKKHRERAGAFLCEGVKLTLEAAEWGRLSEVLVRESDAPLHEETVKSVLEVGCGVFVLSDSAFDKVTTEKAPQGIIGVASVCREGEDAIGDGLVLLLDCVRDPGNLGAILRSACALGGVTVALHSCVDLYGPKTVRAAMGAIFKTRVVFVEDAVAFVSRMRESGRRVLSAALDASAMKLGQYETRENDVIVIGNEGHGISSELIEASSGTMIIPMEANTESLNASVAASVILWEYARRG